jgi:TRAP-type C4-dicarboxylate transport system permease small subunit
LDPLSHSDLPAASPTAPERALAALAAVGLALLCVIVTVTVIVRAAGFVLIPDDVLLVQELMVAVNLLPLAVLTARRRHIAVTLFTERLGMRAQAALALLGHLVGLLFGGALAWVAGSSFSAALASGEYYDGELYLPTWIGWAVFALGIGVFALRLLALLARDARLLAAPHPPAA